MANISNLTLLTDLYELTMMQGYYKEKINEHVVFDLFYRTNPCNGGYAICAGLEQAVDYLKNLHFGPEEISYLKSLGIFDDDFLAYLAAFRFQGDIYAIPEGTVVFPMEPLMKIVGNAIEAQLVETALLNIINHQSLIATKTSRVVYAAQGDGVLEFGLRRAQGPDAGLYGARAAMIAGCTGTSNVLAGQVFDVPVRGTHAHAWIMSFPDELSAFRAYSKIYPGACILLVDTYDTLGSGVPHAIQVFQEMRDAGLPMKGYGIRLDSGDLAYLSKEAKKMLDAAGFTDAIISASNDLDEYLITSLKLQGATINAWGVGTKLITSSNWSAFGGVYKLAAVMGKDGEWIPKIKLSENPEKITNPGNKTVFRIYSKDEEKKIIADVIALADETIDENEPLLLFDPINTWKKTKLKPGTYTVREILEPVFIKGECVFQSRSVMELSKICKAEKSTLWDGTLRLENPHKVHVDLSRKLYDMKTNLLNEIASAQEE